MRNLFFKGIVWVAIITLVVTALAPLFYSLPSFVGSGEPEPAEASTDPSEEVSQPKTEDVEETEK